MTRVHQEPISGIDKKDIKASLNRDSVLVLISAAMIIMKNRRLVAKNGNG